MNTDRVRKFLGLAGSANDAEATQALRRAQAILAAEGVGLPDLLDAWVARRAATRHPVQPPCSVRREGGAWRIAAAPSPQAAEFQLPDIPGLDPEALACALADALGRAASAGAGVRVRIQDAPDGSAEVIADIAAVAEVSLWSGSRGDAALLASVLRRTAAHALGGA